MDADKLTELRHEITLDDITRTAEQWIVEYCDQKVEVPVRVEQGAVKLTYGEVAEIYRENFGIEDVFEAFHVYVGAKRVAHVQPSGPPELQSIGNAPGIPVVGEIVVRAKNYIRQDRYGGFAASSMRSESANRKSAETDSEWERLLKRLESLELSIKGTAEQTNLTQWPVHKDILCDGCQGLEPGVRVTNTETADEKGFIKGTRYKCLQCEDYDLCQKCESAEVASGTHDASHNMLKMADPSSIARTFDRVSVSSIETDSAEHASAVPEPREIDVDGFYGKNTNPVPDQRSTADFSEHTEPVNEVNDAQQCNDVIIEVGQKNKALFDFFSDIRTEDQLHQVMQDVISWRVAKKWYGDNIYDKLEKFKADKKEMDILKQQESELAEEAEAEKDTFSQYVRVVFSRQGDMLKLTVRNCGEGTLAGVLRVEAIATSRKKASSTVTHTFNLQPCNIKPNTEYHYLFEAAELMKRYRIFTPDSVQIFDKRGIVVYALDEILSSGSILYLESTRKVWNPVESFRRVLDNEEYEGIDGQYKEPSVSVVNPDAVLLADSSTLETDTDVELSSSSQHTSELELKIDDLVFVDSQSEDYDLLSDSDFE